MRLYTAYARPAAPCRSWMRHATLSECRRSSSGRQRRRNPRGGLIPILRHRRPPRRGTGRPCRRTRRTRRTRSSRRRRLSSSSCNRSRSRRSRRKVVAEWQAAEHAEGMPKLSLQRGAGAAGVHPTPTAPSPLPSFSPSPRPLLTSLHPHLRPTLRRSVLAFGGPRLRPLVRDQLDRRQPRKEVDQGGLRPRVQQCGQRALLVVRRL